ncbi:MULTISPECIES: hypothetical protein [unclassified Brevundimonas]|uniref:hypothetical protein n=1 Tax=unclassified Brevundimonas TaxID=2622653 RepID=UPI0025BB7037|nr:MULTISPECIES: hypothetical protein [unclassified Brevundimonas]
MEPVERDRHKKAADAVQQGRPVDADYVRSSGKGKSVLPILVISTLLAAVLLIGAFAIFSGTSGDVDRSVSEKAAQSAEFAN